MKADEVILEVLNILDLNLGFVDTDKSRIRGVMKELFENKVTQDAIDLLEDMARQQEGYAGECIENIENLELAHRLFGYARRFKKILASGQ